MAAPSAVRVKELLIFCEPMAVHLRANDMLISKKDVSRPVVRSVFYLGFNDYYFLKCRGLFGVDAFIPAFLFSTFQLHYLAIVNLDFHRAITNLCKLPFDFSQHIVGGVVDFWTMSSHSKPRRN